MLGEKKNLISDYSGMVFWITKTGSDHDLKTRVVLNAGNYSDSTNTCPTVSIIRTGGLTNNEHCISSARGHGVGLPNTAQLWLVKLGAQAEGTGSEDRLIQTHSFFCNTHHRSWNSSALPTLTT